VDVLGHRDDTAVAAALAELASKAPFLKLLGSYPADRAASAPPASLREDDGGPA
jgi:prephenate dehydratase